MNDIDVRHFVNAVDCFGRISAANARLMGMVALNQERQNHGHALAYSEDAFEVASETLGNIAAECIC